MAFSSLSEFLSMGGYGAYVWSAFFISFLALFILVFATRQHGKRLRDELQRRLAREQRISQANNMERHL